MNDGSDHDFISLQSVNNPVAVDHELAEVLVVELGDFAPGKRKLNQYL
jgi:hypothetical protein